MVETETAISCWLCGETMPESDGLRLAPGWSLRVDGIVGSCPKHKEFMPPHPKSNELERNQ
jgi:hypothetical protein